MIVFESNYSILLIIYNSGTASIHKDCLITFDPNLKCGHAHVEKGRNLVSGEVIKGVEESMAALGNWCSITMSFPEVVVVRSEVAGGSEGVRCSDNKHFEVSND